MLAIQVDQVKCDGCGRCMAVCQTGNLLSKGRPGAGLARPLIWIAESENMRRIDICRHCETPVCADACVAGAISADQKSSTIQLSADKCIGCWSCVLACPFNALRLEGERALKCDGCLTLKNLLCVSVCPTGALKAANESTGLAAHRRRERASVMGRPDR